MKEHDLYTELASKALSIPIEKVTKKQRNDAKWYYYSSYYGFKYVPTV